MQTSDSYMDDLLLYFYGKPFEFSLYRPVSYTHLTLPTILLV